MTTGNFTQPTYMVGGEKEEGIKPLIGAKAYPMRHSKNGRGGVNNFYQPGRRYNEK